MFLSICFNPEMMDYSSWLTVASILMALISIGLYQFDDKKFPSTHKMFTFIYSTLSVLTLLAILCFIINLEPIGAVLVTIVLILLVLHFPLLLVFTPLLADMSINSSVKKIQPGNDNTEDF